jgi:GNAT superfamily N-acetyltransferase
VSEVVFREVSQENWRDFAGLFESRGGPKSCWCMVWRSSATGTKQSDGASRRAAMESKVEAGAPIGILGYRDGAAIAWCSIAPRDTYRNLGGLDDRGPPERVWALACFFVKREHRGHGISKKLLQAAIAHAARNGATVVEAYPVDPDSPSYRFMGFIETFSEAGFQKVGQAGQRRHVMRLPIAHAPDEADQETMA